MATFAVTNDLSWTVSKRPLFFAGNDGQPTQWTEKVAIVRDDTGRALGTVSNDYEIVQNDTLLSLINPMVEEGTLTVENMGYLNYGARVFAQAKIAQEFRVLGEDYSAFITLLNGHVGNASVAIGPAAVRVICGNTFAMAYAGIGEKYRHMLGVNQKVLDSKAVINYVNAAMGKYAEHVEKLERKSCSAGEFNRAMSEIFQKDTAKIKQIEVLNNLFYNGAGNSGRTYYDAFNAVTDFSSNRSRRTTDGRFNYANFGAGANLNQRAMRVLTELAAV
jgi:phage/plasmid-like protein (TIGR03299 family)